MDVVPVFPEKWTHPPFAAEMDAEGRIYARGTQDMKSLGMQYLAAIRALKKKGIQLKRTLHVTFVPDEEIGGFTGMEKFVRSEDFKEMNVGFALDEGRADPENKYLAFYAERTIWQIKFVISGTAGHGSLLLSNTAGVKFHYLLDKLMGYRQRELTRMENDPNLYIGDVTSINLTQINGGVQSNVIPPTMEAIFDMRIAIDVNLEEFDRQIHSWCAEAGGGIELEWIQKIPFATPTKVDASNPYWMAMQKAVKALGITLEPHVFGGGTDIQFVRELNIPSIGFSPITGTPMRAHDHDEFLKADTYLQGIDIYVKILQEVANLE